MAITARTKAAKAASRGSASVDKKAAHAHGQDATILLENDHRDVEGYFEEYEAAETGEDKKRLATQICLALKVNAQIEEEIFYPAARKATKDNDLLDEATVEHAGAKNIDRRDRGDGAGPAGVRRKAQGSERTNPASRQGGGRGLFPDIRETKLDLEKLGADLAARKAEVMAALKPSAPTVA